MPSYVVEIIPASSGAIGSQGEISHGAGAAEEAIDTTGKQASTKRLKCTVNMSAAQNAAIRLFLAHIKLGTDTSAAVSAIDAL